MGAAILAKRGKDMDFNKLRDAHPELFQALNVAKMVSFRGAEVLNDMICKMWNQEWPTEEEVWDHRMMVIDMFGMDEVRTRLALRDITIPPEFESYYQLVK